MDKITEQRIALLHPHIKDEVTQLITKANQALTTHSQVRIVQGLRTIEEQDGLYALGRTKPGKIVTNAKGGSSYHNYGLGIDFCLMIDDTQVSWDTKKDFDGDGQSDWLEVVKIFKASKYEWGGDFKKIVDYPHFQKTFGYSVKELRAKYQAKDFIPDTQYVNL